MIETKYRIKRVGDEYYPQQKSFWWPFWRYIGEYEEMYGDIMWFPLVKDTLPEAREVIRKILFNKNKERDIEIIEY